MQTSQKPPARRTPGAFAFWKSRLVQIAIVAAIVGLVYGIPELNGRRDATALCEAIPVGTVFDSDMKRLQDYRDAQRKTYSTLYAAKHYARSPGVEDGRGAILLVFLAGFPFSRAYCVLHLGESAVQSKQVIFNAEDHEYCAGEVRPMWNCPDAGQRPQGS